MLAFVGGVIIVIGAALVSYSVSFQTLRARHPAESLPETALRPHSVSWWSGNVLWMAGVYGLFSIRWYAGLMGILAAFAAGCAFHAVWMEVWPRRWFAAAGGKAPGWLHMLPQELRPSPQERVDKLERLRRRYSMDDAAFSAAVLQSDWATRTVQWALYERTKESRPDLRDREIFRMLILSRSDRVFPIGLHVTDEEVEEVLDQVGTIDELAQYLIEKDMGDGAPDRNGQAAEVQREVAQIMRE